MTVGAAFHRRRSPLAQVDVDAGDGQGVGGVGVSCHDGDIVVSKADAQVRERAGVDHANPVRLSCLHSHILPLAACGCLTFRIWLPRNLSLSRPPGPWKRTHGNAIIAQKGRCQYIKAILVDKSIIYRIDAGRCHPHQVWMPRTLSPSLALRVQATFSNGV